MSLEGHVCFLFVLQNFSPQMSGGYDEKSPAMPVPGPMVGHVHPSTCLLFSCDLRWRCF